jgi:hypothetical protein
MDPLRAREILQALIDGLDPVTRAELPPDSPMQQAEVLRALLAAQGALRAAGMRAARRAALPPNVGQPWTEDEFARMLEARRAGASLEELAQKHGRTVRAIQSRLQLMDAESFSGTTSRETSADTKSR